MASGVLGGDEAREKKRRFPESNKVYSRKNPKKPKNSHHVSLPHHQTLTTEDNNFDAVASEDDSSSHNRNARELDNGNAAFSRYKRIALDSMRRSEVGELRRKLVSELNQVRDSMKKIEAKEVRFAANSERLRGLGGSVVAENHDQQRRTPKGNPNMVKEKEKKKKKLKSNADGDGDELDWNSSPVFKSSSDLLMKLMRHKFGWVFNKPVDAKGLGLHDYNTIVKHPMDLGTVKTKMDKNWYKSPREFAEDVRLTFSNAMLYNPKGQDVHFMAEQLAKVFEDQWKNVEAEFNRIRRIEMGRDAGLPTPASRKTPMLARVEMGRDAGLPTPASRKTPMLPTPTSRKTPMPGRAKTGRDAGLPTPTSRKTPMLARAEMGHGADFPTPTSRKTPMLARGPAPAPAPAQAQAQAQDPAPSPPPPPPPVETRTLERSESRTMPVNPKLKPPGYGQLGRTTILKKPKAKDPDKRDMTYEEKQRLSLNLQSLPSDKLDNIVQIIKKRNPTLFQHDDEIEVDIASVDPETLWELDRFVTNYKKSLSKNKRRTEIAIQSEAEGEVEAEAEAEGEAQVEAEVEAQVEAEVEVVEVEAEAEVEVVEAEVEVDVEVEAEAEAEVEVEAEAEAEAEAEVEVEVEVDSETDHAIPETVRP